jgi:hypothetical protein
MKDWTVWKELTIQLGLSHGSRLNQRQGDSCLCQWMAMGDCRYCTISSKREVVPLASEGSVVGSFAAKRKQPLRGSGEGPMRLTQVSSWGCVACPQRWRNVWPVEEAGQEDASSQVNWRLSCGSSWDQVQRLSCPCQWMRDSWWDSHCQKPKRRGHYVNAKLGWAWICKC